MKPKRKKRKKRFASVDLTEFNRKVDSNRKDTAKKPKITRGKIKRVKLSEKEKVVKEMTKLNKIVDNALEYGNIERLEQKELDRVLNKNG